MVVSTANTNPIKNISEPNFVQLEPLPPTVQPYEIVIDVALKNFVIRETIFKNFHEQNIGGRIREVEVVPSPSLLTELFFPLTFINKLVESSNNYRTMRKRKFPNLYDWKRRQSSPFTTS